jgi:hypothetical protein
MRQLDKKICSEVEWETWRGTWAASVCPSMQECNTQVRGRDQSSGRTQSHDQPNKTSRAGDKASRATTKRPCRSWKQVAVSLAVPVNEGQYYRLKTLGSIGPLVQCPSKDMRFVWPVRSTVCVFLQRAPLKTRPKSVVSWFFFGRVVVLVIRLENHYLNRGYEELVSESRHWSWSVSVSGKFLRYVLAHYQIFWICRTSYHHDTEGSDISSPKR